MWESSSGGRLLPAESSLWELSSVAILIDRYSPLWSILLSDLISWFFVFHTGLGLGADCSYSVGWQRLKFDRIAQPAQKPEQELGWVVELSAADGARDSDMRPCALSADLDHRHWDLGLLVPHKCIKDELYMSVLCATDELKICKIFLNAIAERLLQLCWGMKASTPCWSHLEQVLWHCIARWAEWASQKVSAFQRKDNIFEIEILPTKTTASFQCNFKDK